MIRKLAAFTLALLLLVSSFSVNAAARASYYLSSYTLGLLAEGNSLMSISYTVQGVDYMDKVGAQEIIVEEYIGGAWYEYRYFDGDDYGLYAYDYFTKSGTLYFYGVAGRAYRCTMTAYASLGSGSDTGEITCAYEYCIE